MPETGYHPAIKLYAEGLDQEFSPVIHSKAMNFPIFHEIHEA